MVTSNVRFHCADTHKRFSFALQIPEHPCKSLSRQVPFMGPGICSNPGAIRNNRYGLRCPAQADAVLEVVHSYRCSRHLRSSTASTAALELGKWAALLAELVFELEYRPGVGDDELLQGSNALSPPCSLSTNLDASAPRRSGHGGDGLGMTVPTPELPA